MILLVSFTLSVYCSDAFAILNSAYFATPIEDHCDDGVVHSITFVVFAAKLASLLITK